MFPALAKELPEASAIDIELEGVSLLFLMYDEIDEAYAKPLCVPVDDRVLPGPEKTWRSHRRPHDGGRWLRCWRHAVRYAVSFRRVGSCGAPLTGLVIAELAAGDRLSYPVEPFLVSRFDRDARPDQATRRESAVCGVPRDHDPYRAISQAP